MFLSKLIQPDPDICHQHNEHALELWRALNNFNDRKQKKKVHEFNTFENFDKN